MPRSMTLISVAHTKNLIWFRKLLIRIVKNLKFIGLTKTIKVIRKLRDIA